jgi:hypothetical protein
MRLSAVLSFVILHEVIQCLLLVERLMLLLTIRLLHKRYLIQRNRLMIAKLTSDSLLPQFSLLVLMDKVALLAEGINMSKTRMSFSPLLLHLHLISVVLIV